MSSLAIAVMTRLAPSSLNQLSLSQNRCGWVSPSVMATRDYARSAEEILGLNKPKRPVTPFASFLSQMAPALKTKHPNAKSTDLLKMAAKHWEQVAPDTKAKIKEEYNVKVGIYQKKMQKFEKSLTPEQLEEITQLKNEISARKERLKLKAEFREQGRPKRPLSAYLLFCGDNQQQTIHEDGLRLFHQRIKEKWSALPVAERAKYEQRATHLMEQYKKDLVRWEEKMIEAGKIELVRKTGANAAARADK